MFYQQIYAFPLGRVPFSLAISTDSAFWWAHVMSGRWKRLLTLSYLLLSVSDWFSNPLYHFILEWSGLCLNHLVFPIKRDGANKWPNNLRFFHPSSVKSVSQQLPLALFMFIREARGGSGFKKMASKLQTEDLISCNIHSLLLVWKPDAIGVATFPEHVSLAVEIRGGWEALTVLVCLGD